MSAAIGISLLIKALRITGGQAERIKAAQARIAELRKAADDDVRAVKKFIASDDPELIQDAIQIPLRAARAAASGLDLCFKASGSVSGLLAADVGVAAMLIRASTRAILACVDANVRMVGPKCDPAILEERGRLEEHATRTYERVMDALR